MERPLLLFGLYLGLDVLELCNGYPVELQSAGFTNAEVWTSLAPILAVVVLVCSVVLLAGCLCCRQTKGFQEFTDSTSSHSLSAAGGYINNAASNTEFTIFPPLPASAQRQTPGDRSSVVRFEPLPEIKPPQAHSRRPAAFNNVVSHGLSAQDWFEDPHVNFPRHQMKYLRELGRGWFGRVVEGEAQGIVTEQKTSKVVVKILHEDATATDHMYFLHEVKAYRDLQHPNLLKLLGRCLETDPFLVLLEACPSGDLKSFLSQNISTAEALSQQGVTLLMGCHVAAGLHHMHQNGFVHTDLAARNCLVTSDLTVKIGDYGTSIETFKEDYYCAGEVALPIRWCAPETLYCTETTIETKEVTQGANVWNLGVVLWEICEFGKLPYSDLTDDEVIVKVLGDGTHRLGLPSRNCPHRQNLYLLMKLCWSPFPQRPALLQVLAMLNHLYSSREKANADDGDSCSLKTDEDFERRWETFKPNTIPKTDNHPTANNSAVQSPSHSLHETPVAVPPVMISNSVGAELNKQDRYLGEHNRPFLFQRASLDNIVLTQDSSNLMADMNSITPLTTSPQPSITSSTGGEFFIPSLQQRHKSPSLQNLRGSLDDLCERNGDEVNGDAFVTENIENIETVQEIDPNSNKDNLEEEPEKEIPVVATLQGPQPESSTVEVISEPDFDSWLQGVETTDEEDAKFVRKISEAIRDLDNALALEKTSSSSSSESSSHSASHHQSPAKEVSPPASDQNVVLDFRLGPVEPSVSEGRFSFTEDLFQPDSLQQEDSLLDKSLPRENRGTDSGTDTEDETWRRRIECGEFSQKVKEKSKSVADLMILTHIDCSDGSDSEPPSLTWSFERSSNGRNSFSRQRRGSNLAAATTLGFGSESNIHQTTLGEEFRDTLMKLHEAQKDNKSIKPGTDNSVLLHHDMLEELPSNLSSSHDPLLNHDENVGYTSMVNCNSTSSNHNRENVFLAIDASERITPMAEVLDTDKSTEIPTKDSFIKSDSNGASFNNQLLGEKNCIVQNLVVQTSRKVPETETVLKDLNKPSHQSLIDNSNVLKYESHVCSEILNKTVPLSIPFSEQIETNNIENLDSAIGSKLENDNVPQLFVIEATQLEAESSPKSEDISVVHSKPTVEGDALHAHPRMVFDVSNCSSDVVCDGLNDQSSVDCNHAVDISGTDTHNQNDHSGFSIFASDVMLTNLSHTHYEDDDSSIHEKAVVPLCSSTPNHNACIAPDSDNSEQLDLSISSGSAKRNLDFSEDLTDISPVLSDTNSSISFENQSELNTDNPSDQSDLNNDNPSDQSELNTDNPSDLSNISDKSSSNIQSSTSTDSFDFIPNKNIECSELINQLEVKESAVPEMIDCSSPLSEAGLPSAANSDLQLNDSSKGKYSGSQIHVLSENSTNVPFNELCNITAHSDAFSQPSGETLLSNASSTKKENSSDFDSETSVILGPCEDYTLDFFKGLKTTSMSETVDNLEFGKSSCIAKSTNMLESVEDGLNVEKISTEIEEADAEISSLSPNREEILGDAVEAINNVIKSEFSSPKITPCVNLSTAQHNENESCDVSSESVIPCKGINENQEIKETITILDSTVENAKLISDQNAAVVPSAPSQTCLSTVNEVSDSVSPVPVEKPVQTMFQGESNKKSCSNANENKILEDSKYISDHVGDDSFSEAGNLHHDSEGPLSVTNVIPSVDMDISGTSSSVNDAIDSSVEEEISSVDSLLSTKSPSQTTVKCPSSGEDLNNSVSDFSPEFGFEKSGIKINLRQNSNEIQIENSVDDTPAAIDPLSSDHNTADIISDPSHKELENSHINKPQELNILGSNNFSLVEDKLNLLSSSLLVPSLNFIAATPVQSGRNSPEFCDEVNADANKESLSEETEIKILDDSDESPLASNIIVEVQTEENNEGKLENSSDTTTKMVKVPKPKSDILFEQLNESSHVNQIAELSIQEKQNVLPEDGCNVGEIQNQSPVPSQILKGNTIVFDGDLITALKSDQNLEKTDIYDAHGIISQLTKEVPLKVAPSEEYMNIDIALLEKKQTVDVELSSPNSESQNIRLDRISKEDVSVHDNFIFDEDESAKGKAHKFCFTESNDSFLKNLPPTDNDAVVENWKKQNIELLSEDFLQAALEVKSFDQELEVQDFPAMFQVGESETPVELEDDGEEFGLDVAKHSTPDDERSSDSGFRDKGSLSESCEDACDEKYNLEDIEAELEETFSKGGFNYVVKGLDGDEEDLEHNSVNLDASEDLGQSNQLLECSEDTFITTNSESMREIPENSSLNDFNEPNTMKYSTTKIEEDILQQRELNVLTDESFKEHCDDTLIPFSPLPTVLSDISVHSSTSGKNVFDFEADELDNSGISTPEKMHTKVQSHAIIDTPDLLNIETCDMPMPDLTSDSKASQKNSFSSPEYNSKNSSALEINSFSNGFEVGNSQSCFLRENDLMLDIGKTEFRTLSPESGVNVIDFLDLSPIKRTGWFLHPPMEEKSLDKNSEINADTEDLFLSPKSTSSTSSKVDESNNNENSYIPLSLDEAFVTAIRNELKEKLPCARQHSHEEEEPEDDGVIDTEDELQQGERADINIHYNIYPAPLSPILEERESVSSITTTVSDNYSPFVSTIKGGLRQDSDSEPTSPVFILDSMDSASREADAKRFEQEIREALENCSLSSGDTDSSSEKAQQNSSVLFEDLDQSPPTVEVDQLEGKHISKNVTVVKDTFQQPDYDDDDFLVVDTETNKATLLESPKPKSYLAFVNNKRISLGSGAGVDASPSLDYLFPEEELTIGHNSDTYIIKRGRIGDKELQESLLMSDCRNSSDNEAFTPDSISPGQERQVPSPSTLFSPDTDNMSEFFLTPSEKSSDERKTQNTPLEFQGPYDSYFVNSLVRQQNENNPTYDKVQEISLGVANNEAAEIISELESSGIFNNVTNIVDADDLMDENIPSTHVEEDCSRVTSENDDSEALSVDESSDSLKSDKGPEQTIKKSLSLNLSTLEQCRDLSKSELFDSPSKMLSQDCLELSNSSGSTEAESDQCVTRLLLNDTLELYKKKKSYEKDDSSSVLEEKDWSVTSLEAALLSTKAPMPSPEEESWKQIPSMLAFSDLNEVISRCDEEDTFGEIMFTGPGSPVYTNQDNDDDLMSTSFSLKGDSEELADCYTPDWESGSEDTNEEDNNSSSSGEFIWKEGDREASVKAVDISHSDVTSKSYEGLSEFPMEVIAEEEEGEDEDDDDDEEDADGSSSSGSGTEFVPSAWNSEATPNRSALRSPDKKTDQKKNVSFKKQKYHCVYEYPREASDSESDGLDSPSRRRWDIYQQDVDYSSYADWELMDGDVPEGTAPDADVDPEVSEVQPQQAVDFYKLSSVDYDFGNGVMSEDGEFYISSSARPFQFSSGSNDVFSGNGSQFFPGQLYQAVDDEEEGESSVTTVAIKDVDLDFTSLDNNVSVNDGNKMSTLGVSVDACDDEVDTSGTAVTVAHKSVDSAINQSTNETVDFVRPVDTKPVSSMHIREVVQNGSSTNDANNITDIIANVEGSNKVASTSDPLDRVRMGNMSPSTNTFTSDASAISSHETNSGLAAGNSKSILSSVNVPSTLEKDVVELIETPPDFSPSSPLSPTSGLGELRHTRDRLKLDLPACSSAFILDPPALGKRRSVEAVKGEASLLDSGEETEDSGIESSNGTTNSRATSQGLEQSESFVLSSSKV